MFLDLGGGFGGAESAGCDCLLELLFFGDEEFLLFLELDCFLVVFGLFFCDGFGFSLDSLLY